MKYDAYLLELPLDSSITGKQMNALLEKAGMDGSYFPVSVEAEHSWAFGVLPHEACDEIYNFDVGPFSTAIRPYLEDEEKMAPFRDKDGSFTINLGDIRVHLYRNLPVQKSYDGSLLSLEEAEQKYGFYGCVDEGNNPRTYLLLNLPHIIEKDPLDPSHIGKYAAYGVPIAECEEPTPCGPTVLLVWDKADGLEMGDDPTIVDLAPYACKKADMEGYCNVWARIGVSLRVPKVELERALATCSGPQLKRMVRFAFENNRFQLDGDSYIPECVSELLVQKYGLNIDATGDIEFEF